MRATATGQDSQDPSMNSISRLLVQIQASEPSVRDELTKRLLSRLYMDQKFAQLSRVAYHRLGTLGARQADEADVMQEAMLVLYQRARRGRLETVDRRERLFGLLRLIVAARARAFRRRAEAAMRGGDVQFVSLDPGAADGSTIGGMHSGLSDPDSDSDRERWELADLLQTLLMRCEQEYPDNPLTGRVFELMLDGWELRDIRRETGASRTLVENVIEAIRATARKAFGREWEELKNEFRGREADGAEGKQ
ncbi:MAG: ECF-type sigma factor [Planctomycetaceae bacterium]